MLLRVRGGSGIPTLPPWVSGVAYVLTPSRRYHLSCRTAVHGEEGPVPGVLVPRPGLRLHVLERGGILP